jgi:putative spermidine/putrescine transport system substrate-binding protein
MILNITSKIALASAALVSVSLTGSAIADVNVVSWGGAYTASQQKGYEPTWTGEKINWINYNGGLGEIRAQVESGNVQWDIVDVLPGEARVGCDEGLFEEIPDEYRLPTPDGVAMEDDLMVPLPNKCVVPQIWWSYAAFFSENDYPSNGKTKHQPSFGVQPKTIADFFDVEKFPGKRGIHTWGNALIEMALVADGVEIADVYDVMDTAEGIDRAFAKLDTIKDHVVFWSSGAKPLELVSSGEVVMSLAYNGRIGSAILNDGQPFVTIWDGQVLEEEWLVVVKGAPNKEEAFKLAAHMSSTEAQAEQAKYINYGPMRNSALTIIAANEPWFNTGDYILKHMPNREEVNARTIIADPDWWADNGAEISERFNAWMAQ